jgi:hypothetical protein
MIKVQRSDEMFDYLRRIKVDEYKVVDDTIYIDLNQQQLWYRMNAESQVGITMKNSKEYAILHALIFTI